MPNPYIRRDMKMYGGVPFKETDNTKYNVDSMKTKGAHIWELVPLCQSSFADPISNGVCSAG